MFIENKYTKIYFNIINKAQDRTVSGYVEKHHIIPKALGGDNSRSNIVKLTAKEHFICHRLLVKMVTDKEAKAKMSYAVWQLSRGSSKKSLVVTSRTYEFLKTQLSESYKGRKRAPFSQKARENMKQGAKNRKKVIYSPERLEKLATVRKNMAGWNKGVKMSLTDEQRQDISSRLSNANKGKPKKKLPCPYCGKEVAVNTFKKWHLPSCKASTS
jgi:hypothetical protein